MDFHGAEKQKDFEIQGPWIPATPAKPIPTRRPVIHRNGRSNPASGSSWLASVDASAATDGDKPPHESTSQGGGSSAPWGFSNLGPDLNDSQEAGSVSQVHGHQPYSHNVGSLVAPFGNPMEGWTQTPYKNLIALTDAAATSKGSSLSAMFAQIAGDHKMPASQNQLLLNRKMLLDTSLHNGDIHSAQKAQYEYPFPFLPNLNSLPQMIASMSASLGVPSPSILTREKNMTVHDQSPRELTGLVDERVSNNKIQAEKRKGHPLVGKEKELCFSMGLGAMPSPSTIEKQKPVRDHLPREVIDLVDDCANAGNMLGKEIRKWQTPVEKHSSLKGVTEAMTSPSAPVTPQKDKKLRHQQHRKVIDLADQKANERDMQAKVNGEWQPPEWNQMELCFAMGVTKEMPSSSATDTPEKNKAVQGHRPWGVIDLAVERVIEGAMEQESGKWQPPEGKQMELLCFSKPEIQPQAISSEQHQSEVCYAKEQQSEVDAVIPSEEVSAQQQDIEENSKRENRAIDLNKTPQQKPKRKKIRPKVVREGKPARTPKPVTPKPATPKPAKNEENPSGKRKYVRRKQVQTPSDIPSNAIGAAFEPKSQIGTISVRRCLNFDSEDSQARDRCQDSILMFTGNAESQARDAFVVGSSSIPSTISAVQIAHGLNVEAGRSPKEATFDLKPVTPEPAKNKENPSGKRKYVRKKKVPNPADTPSSAIGEIFEPNSQSGTTSGKRKYVRKKKVQDPSDTPSSAIGEVFEPNSQSGTTSGKRKYVRRRKVQNPSDVPSTAIGDVFEPNSQSGTKSVRRRLNFDSEDSQARDRCQDSTLMFKPQAQGAYVAGSASSSSTISAVQLVQGLDVVAGHSPAELIFDLNRSANQIRNEDIRHAGKPACPQLCRREMVMSNQMLDGHRRVPQNQTTVAQSFRRELIRGNLNALAKKNDYLKTIANSDRSSGTCQDQFDSYNISNSMMSESQRGSGIVYNTQVSTHMNLMHASNGIDEVNDGHKTGVCDPYSTEINKRTTEINKRRTEKEQNEKNGLTSSASSSVAYMLPDDRKTNQILVDNLEEFTFADAQRLMALEKLRASEGVLAFHQTESKMMKGPEAPVHAHNLTSTSATTDCNHMPTPIKQPRPRHGLDCNQLYTPTKPFGGNDSQVSEVSNPEIRMEALNTNASMKTKKRAKKERAHSVGPEHCLQEYDAASCNSGSSPGLKTCQATALASENLQEKNSHLKRSPVDDSQSSSNSKESLGGNFISGAIVPYGDPLDDLIQKMRYLQINRGHEVAAAQAQNALVPYEGGQGRMVPYEGIFNLTRKRRPRPKVDLDPETDRVWKLLMGKEARDEAQGMGMDKERWWEEERRIFRGRVDSFIARMHLVQGDRRFSPWKGSVVDSVVGVFLTQNVSDHLSSSAFMALAARFPLKSRGNSRKFSSEMMSTPIKPQDRCIEASDNATKWQEMMSGKEVYDRSPLVTIGGEKRADSNESFGSNVRDGVVEYSIGKLLNSQGRELEIGHESPDSRSGTPVTVMGSTSAVEAEDRRSVEDVVSSQNSVASSQNSSEFVVQAAEQLGSNSLPNFETEDLVIGTTSNGMDSSTSFTELLQIAERIPPTNYCSGINWFACPDVEKRMTVLDPLNNLKGAYPLPHASSSSPQHVQLNFTSAPSTPSMSYNFNQSLNSTMMEMGNANVLREESRSFQLAVASGITSTNNINKINGSCGPSASNKTEKLLLTPESIPAVYSYSSISRHNVQQSMSSEAKACAGKCVCCSHNNLPNERSEISLGKAISNNCSHLQDEFIARFQNKEKEPEIHVESTLPVQVQTQNSGEHQLCSDLNSKLRNAWGIVEGAESSSTVEANVSQKVSSGTAINVSKAKVKAESEKKKTYDWDSLRKEVHRNGDKKERTRDAMDSLDWEAVRCADVSEISETIRERGMNNMLAERIKEFLNRLVKDHGSIDLEWLRDIEPDKSKDFLLSIWGLGLKSVECVRLLTLHHLAFPVDTNVGRICVRLGWVPLQPLPESLQLHLLELYPVLETIQKYLWPRLCKLDQRTLYELHYQLITFGKVFCTKSKPNCNACPMRGECKHFASAFASARLALPGPEEKSIVSSAIPIAFQNGHTPVANPMPLPQLEGSTISKERACFNKCEPIIEEPATPEAECMEAEEGAIEDAFSDDPDEIPTIKLNFEEFTQNLQNYMQENNMELQDADMSKALVAITPDVASIPMPKLKNVSRLRTEHQVYELPDSHPLLEGLDKREPDDPCSYLLAIWTPGETAQSTEPPQAFCNSQETGKLCDRQTCFACNSLREAQAQTVRATLLIPCRTAMRGSFPLNGTYFQVNEVFADHDTSRNPVDVPRDWIWNLPRRTVYFGTSIPTIFKGLTTEGIQQCFWRGFVCVRGFDRSTRAPRPLYARLHFPASKAPKKKRTAAAARVEK